MTHHFQDYIPEIDALRGIAITLVLFFHLQIPFFQGGYIGVDIFFVISGFLIANSLTSKKKVFKKSLKVFFIKRVIRLFPVYIFALISVIGMSFFLGIETRSLDKLLFNILFIYNYYIYNLHDAFLAQMGEFPLAHFWSLSIEAQFYLLSPLLIFKLIPFFYKHLGYFRFLFTTIFWIFYVCMNQVNDEFAFFDISSRLWQFLLGIEVYFYSLDHTSKTKKQFLCSQNKIIMLSFIVLIIACIAPFPTQFERLLRTSLASISTALVLIALTRNQPIELKSKLLNMNILIYIGKLSYSIYIWHYIIIILLGSAIASYVQVPFFSKVLVLIITFMISIMSYHLLEVKVGSLLKNSLSLKKCLKI